ncbi:MAG: hypothetical protein Q9159_006622 [Coniocarpon cinnabarinum]
MAHRQLQYGRCSSFFVESEKSWDGLYAQRQEQRQKHRSAARQKQRELAMELSNITADEYQDDILDHMESMEHDTLPDVLFIDMQTEIQWSMRPYLLDFLIEAHTSFVLLPETLYLAVNILDRYCSRRVVYKRHYQLVGCAALLVAAKYGDRKDRVPTVTELKSMCCSVYEEEMFTQMEWHVLVTLDWTIGHPTVDAFLQILLSEEAVDMQVEHLTSYICETALYHRDFVSVAPSVLSRAALALARCVLSKQVDNSNYWSGDYQYPVFMELYRKARMPSRVLVAKYSTPQMSSVAQAMELFMMRQDRLDRANAPHTPPVGFLPESQPVAPSLVLPSTPQKGQPGPMSAYGYMTPPITPDGPQCAQQQGLKAGTESWIPSAYTPPPSTEQYTSHPDLHAMYSTIHRSGATYYGH